MRQRRIRRCRGDEGAALVIALVFLVIVGLFAAVALNRSGTTLASGQQVRERGDIQYALDGGVERALQVLKAELAADTPASCGTPGGPTKTETITLNGQSVTWTCELEGGSTSAGDPGADELAIVVTRTGNNRFETQSGSSRDLSIAGSIYVVGNVIDGNLKKDVIITEGYSFLQPCPPPRTQATIDAITNVILHENAAGQLGTKGCTTLTSAAAQGTVSIPPAPTYAVPIKLQEGVQATVGGKKCEVFPPGRYAKMPALVDGDNYFISGLYHFVTDETLSVGDDDQSITGGRNAAGSQPAGTCQGMTDNIAVQAIKDKEGITLPATARFDHGVTLVFSGKSRLALGQADVHLFAPPSVDGGRPVSIVGFPARTPLIGSPHYPAIDTSDKPLISQLGNKGKLLVYGQVFAPASDVELTASGNEVDVLLAQGIVVGDLHIKNPQVGTFAIRAPAPSSAAPPFRTVRIVATSNATGVTATNTAIATISNSTSAGGDGPYAVSVKSWRTH